jgi:hypothetical protein
MCFVRNDDYHDDRRLGSESLFRVQTDFLGSFQTLDENATNSVVCTLSPFPDGSDVIGYSTVIKYLRQRQFSSTPCQTADEHPATVIDNAILDALTKQPFSSVREPAQLTCITRSTLHAPRSIVHRHLTQSLGFVVKHLRWIPYNLMAPQKVKRITFSNELLHELRLIKYQGWEFIITLNEPWFDLAMCHEQIWLRPEETPPESARHTIQDRKIMVTIAWNPL